MKLILAALCVIAGCSAQAEVTLPTAFIYGVGERALTYERAREALDLARLRVREELGVHLRVDAEYRVRLHPPSPDYDYIPAQHRTLSRLRRFLDRGKRRKRINIGVISPLKMGEVFYVGGLASDICSIERRGVAFANCQEENQAGAPRFNHSVTVITHELTHLLGGHHTNELPATVMHPNAAAFVDEMFPLPFAEGTKAEVRVCVERRSGG